MGENRERVRSQQLTGELRCRRTEFGNKRSDVDDGSSDIQTFLGIGFVLHRIVSSIAPKAPWILYRCSGVSKSIGSGTYVAHSNDSVLAAIPYAFDIDGLSQIPNPFFRINRIVISTSRQYQQCLAHQNGGLARHA